MHLLRSNIVAEPAVVDQLGACKPASKLTDPAEVADADPVEARRALRDAHALVEVLPVPAHDAATDRRRNTSETSHQA